MPVINVTIGPLTSEQKKRMIEQMVQVSMDITGAPEGAHQVVIHECPLDALSMGKKSVSEILANQ